MWNYLKQTPIIRSLIPSGSKRSCGLVVASVGCPRLSQHLDEPDPMSEPLCDAPRISATDPHMCDALASDKLDKPWKKTAPVIPSPA